MLTLAYLHAKTNFALKTNLATLRTEVDKLDIDKLVLVHVDLKESQSISIY